MSQSTRVAFVNNSVNVNVGKSTKAKFGKVLNVEFGKPRTLFVDFGKAPNRGFGKPRAWVRDALNMGPGSPRTWVRGFPNMGSGRSGKPKMGSGSSGEKIPLRQPWDKECQSDILFPEGCLDGILGAFFV